MKPKRKISGPQLLVIILVGYLVVLPLGIVAVLALTRHPKNFESATPVVVPQLIGLELKEAEAKARNAQLRPDVLLHRWDIPAPLGTIVGQVPEAGEKVPPGTMVGLELNVPDPNARLPRRK